MPNVLLLGMGERPYGAGLLDVSGVREPCRLVGERSCGSQTSSWVADQQLGRGPATGLGLGQIFLAC